MTDDDKIADLLLTWEEAREHPFVGDDVSNKLERADMNVNAATGLKGGLTGGFTAPF